MGKIVQIGNVIMLMHAERKKIDNIIISIIMVWRKKGPMVVGIQFILESDVILFHV